MSINYKHGTKQLGPLNPQGGKEIKRRREDLVISGDGTVKIRQRCREARVEAKKTESSTRQLGIRGRGKFKMRHSIHPS